MSELDQKLTAAWSRCSLQQKRRLLTIFARLIAMQDRKVATGGEA